MSFDSSLKEAVWFWLLKNQKETHNCKENRWTILQ